MNIIKFKDVIKTPESVKLVSNKFAKQDNIFLGWSKSPEGDTIDYTDEQEVNDITEDTNLYAVWKECYIKPNIGEITFHLDELTKTIEIQTKNLLDDITVSIYGENADNFIVSPEVISKDAESTLLSITFNPSGDIQSYNAKLSLNGLGDNDNFISSIIKLHGVHELIPGYEVNFYYPDGTDTITVEEGQTIPEELIPSGIVSGEPGYDKFVGWIDEKTLQNYLVPNTDVPKTFKFETTIMQSLNLYAIFSKDSKHELESAEKIVDINTLTSDDRVVIINSDSKVAMGSFQSSYMTPEPITMSGDFISNVQNATVYTLLKSGTDYQLVCNENNYLFFSGAKNTLHTTNDASNIGTYWTLSISNGQIHINSKKENKYEIRYNKGGTRFACYAGTVEPIDLYKKQTISTTEYQSFLNLAPKSQSFKASNLMLLNLPYDEKITTPSIVNYIITYYPNGGYGEEYTQNFDASDDIFNKLYKGKYAFWPRLTYIIPIDNVSLYQDIELNDLPELMDESILFADDYKDYIDMHETLKINDNISYEYKNKFVADDDITIDEVKRFRTWLAESLLELFLHEDAEKLVLNYYKGEMNDSTIDNIKLVYNSQYELENIKTTNCGCVNQNPLDMSNVDMCNPINTYRKDIYNKMVEMFSNIDYWVDRKLLCPEIVKYLQNIIRLNLPLFKSTYISEFVDCTCTDIDTQKEYIKIIERLVDAMNKIANDEVQGNKNFIQDALKQWASILYESMRWI